MLALMPLHKLTAREMMSRLSCEIKINSCLLNDIYNLAIATK
jgi:hypothetical protein